MDSIRFAPGIAPLLAAAGLALAGPAAAAATADSAATAAHASESAFPVRLGAFATTLIGSQPDRTQNLRLAAAALDGAVLGPGEVLSFNAVVGPRSVERGYRAAPVILRETRQLQLGGGICQVSSTMMVAALLSGLTLAERHRHSSPVDYVPLGQDATISWGVKDLKLRNDHEHRVRLRTQVVGGTLAAWFEGEAPLEDHYDLVAEEREIPGDPGVGSLPGREIEMYRVRRIAGEELARELLYVDKYPPARGPER